ncbi:MAG: DUF459 domain-containing protein [Rhizobiales bacterium]|nr:DUF459 domain-containing protein [Hyphomicrobiales bacterium]
MRLKVYIAVALFLAGSSWAVAQEQPTPTQDPIGPLRQPATTTVQERIGPDEQPSATDEQTPEKRNTYLPAQESYDVFVLGDSLAGGLYAGMERLTIGNKELKVDGRFKEDSGIARPEFYDWNAAIPKILESNKVDIAVILIGTNDAQPMTVGDERIEFGTPQWAALYAREVDRLINTARQGGAAVYWVSLPPMQALSYNASITEIAAIQKRQAEAAAVKYIDVRPQLTDADGGMMVRGPDDTGELRKIRDNDGIRFMKVGNNKLARMILDVIEADIANARSTTPVSENVAAPIVEDATGKAEADWLSPEPLSAEGAITTGKSDAAPNGKTDLALRGAITEPPPEHPTARFFRTGESPPPVPGRFDDFSYTE